MTALRLAELCAGYGGIGLALDSLGINHDIAWYAETDPDASAVMAAHTTAPNLGDLTEIGECPPVDIVAAGFPCQPVSVQGSRKGVEDARWLIYDVVAVWRLSGARWLILENVPGLLSANDGEAFGQVVDSITQIGATARWTHNRASDIGAPHTRQRWFCIVERDETLRDPKGLGGYVEPDPEPRESRQSARPARRPNRVDLIAEFGVYAQAVAHWANVLGRPAPTLIVDRRLNPAFAEWMMGLPSGWVTDHVPPRRARTIIGNGVVPQQAGAAIRKLVTV